MVYDPFGPGPHAVGTRTLRLADGMRPAACEVWSPDGGDGLPLVVFSHLSGGSRLSSSFLCRHLAGHGYAVAALDHSDMVARRVPEVRLVLAELLAAAGELRLDGTRVGVVGHSFGGWTVLATPDREPRVGAVVALAPGGASRPRPGILAVGLEFAWGRDVPTLYLAGDEDVMTPLDGITELYERTPATARMFVLHGVDHLHFVDDVEAAHEPLRLGTLPGDAAWIPAAMRPLAELCPPAPGPRGGPRAHARSPRRHRAGRPAGRGLPAPRRRDRHPGARHRHPRRLTGILAGPQRSASPHRRLTVRGPGRGGRGRVRSRLIPRECRCPNRRPCSHR